MIKISKENWNIDKIVKDFVAHCAKHEIAVMEHVDPWKEKLMDCPDESIEKIVDIYNKGLDDAYTDSEGKNNRAFIEAYAGGPAEHVPWAVYNAVGSIYPYLSREQKDKALRKLFNIWDGINWAYVNGERSVGHTTGIREPLLLADIEIARRIYWPGLDEARFVLSKFDNFKSLKENIINSDGLFNPKIIKSDFQVAYGLLRSDFCNFGEEYISTANPTFLERTLRAIVWMRFGVENANPDFKVGVARLQELLPESLHNKIEPLRQEGGWTDYNKFK